MINLGGEVPARWVHRTPGLGLGFGVGVLGLRILFWGLGPGVVFRRKKSCAMGSLGSLTMCTVG